jgi:hypothetical protein
MHVDVRQYHISGPASNTVDKGTITYAQYLEKNDRG